MVCLLGHTTHTMAQQLLREYYNETTILSLFPQKQRGSRHKKICILHHAICKVANRMV